MLPPSGLLTSGFLQEGDISSISLTYDDGSLIVPSSSEQGHSNVSNSGNYSTQQQQPISKIVIKAVHQIHPDSTAFLLGTDFGGLILYDSAPDKEDEFNPYIEVLEKDYYKQTHHQTGNSNSSSSDVTARNEMVKFRVARRFVDGIPIGAQHSSASSESASALYSQTYNNNQMEEIESNGNGTGPFSSSSVGGLPKLDLSSILRKPQSPFQLQFGSISYIQVLSSRQYSSFSDVSSSSSSHPPPPPIILQTTPSNTIFILPNGFPTPLSTSLNTGTNILTLPPTDDYAKVSVLSVRRINAEKKKKVKGGMNGNGRGRVANHYGFGVTDILITGDENGKVRVWPLDCILKDDKHKLMGGGGGRYGRDGATVGGKGSDQDWSNYSSTSTNDLNPQSIGVSSSASSANHLDFKSKLSTIDNQTKYPVYTQFQAHVGIVMCCEFIGVEGPEYYQEKKNSVSNNDMKNDINYNSNNNSNSNITKNERYGGANRDEMKDIMGLGGNFKSIHLKGLGGNNTNNLNDGYASNGFNNDNTADEEDPFISTTKGLFATGGVDKELRIWMFEMKHQKNEILGSNVSQSAASGGFIQITPIRSLSISGGGGLLNSSSAIMSCKFFTFGRGVNNVMAVAGTGGGTLYFWGKVPSKERDNNDDDGDDNHDNDDFFQEGTNLNYHLKKVMNLNLISVAEHTSLPITHLGGSGDNLYKEGFVLAGDQGGIVRLYRKGDGIGNLQQQDEENEDEEDNARQNKISSRKKHNQGLLPVAEVKIAGPPRCIEYYGPPLTTLNGTILVACEGGEICQWMEGDLPLNVPSRNDSSLNQRQKSAVEDKLFSDAFNALEEEERYEVRGDSDVAAAFDSNKDVSQLLSFARDRKGSVVDKILLKNQNYDTSVPTKFPHYLIPPPKPPSNNNNGTNRVDLASSPQQSISGSSQSTSSRKLNSSSSSPFSSSSLDSSSAGMSTPGSVSDKAVMFDSGHQMLAPRSMPPPMPSPLPKRPNNYNSNNNNNGGGGRDTTTIINERGRSLMKSNEMTAIEKLQEEKGRPPPLAHLGLPSNLNASLPSQSNQDQNNFYTQPHPLSVANLQSTLYYQKDVLVAGGKKFNPELIQEREEERILAARQTTNFKDDERIFTNLVQLRTTSSGQYPGADDSSIAITLPERKVSKQVDSKWLHNVEVATPTASELLPPDAEPIVKMAGDFGDDGSRGVAAKIIRGEREKGQMAMIHVRRSMGAF